MKGEEEKSTKLCALKELLNLKFNFKMIKVKENSHTWPLFIA